MSLESAEPRRVGRYLVYGPIASGGMATVHFGALVGEAGFSRTVAIKRLRTDKQSRSMLSGLIDEARLVSRVSHPNVVPTLDVVWDEGELLVILEYVSGESLSRLLRRADELEQPIPMHVAITLMAGVLHGLHAAHDAKSLRGKPLGMVHRDVSPQNILVGTDGLARLLDFGIAHATERLSRSVAGQVKGKLGYVAPEQLKNRVDRRTDIYAAAVVLWEMLAGRRLFWGKTAGEILEKLVHMEVPPPSAHAPEVPHELDALVLRGLARAPEDRFESARHFALALESGFGTEAASRIGAWVQELAGDTLSARAEQVALLERAASGYVSSETVAGFVPETHEMATENTTTITRLPRSEPPSTMDETIVDTDEVAPRKRRAVVVVVAGAVAALAAALLIQLTRPQPPPRLNATPPPADEPTAAPMAPAEPTVEAAPSPAPPPTPLAKPPPRVVSSSVPAESAIAEKPTDCTPPYTVDARGIRRLKPECL